MALRCLIDTNIFIQLEETDEEGLLRKDFADLARLCSKHSVALYCHPHSALDLGRDQNTERRRQSLSRLKKYPILESPPIADRPELEILFGGIGKSNDLIDCQILFALSRNCSDYLISEDDGVHKRAKYAKLDSRVFSVREAIGHLHRLFEPQSDVYPHISDEYAYSIPREDEILKSVSMDYAEFDKWFDKSCREHRRAWIVRIEKEIAAICIRKDEFGASEFEGLGNRVLKLCTFTVLGRYRGSRIGELILKQAFSYCVDNAYSATYLTVYPKHEYLIHWLKDFGFQIHQKQTSHQEFVFYKTFTPPPNLPIMNPVDYHVRYSPYYYSTPGIQKFLIPIRPEYHYLLFPEIAIQPELPLSTVTHTIPGNTIKKVYLCHAKTERLSPGDLLFFYKSQDGKVTTLGIIERAQRANEFSEALRMVAKRSVYTYAQIKEMVEKPLLVIEFRFIRHFKSGVGLAELKKLGILNGPPQSIVMLPHERFQKLEACLD